MSHAPQHPAPRHRRIELEERVRLDVVQQQFVNHAQAAEAADQDPFLKFEFK